MTAIKNWLEVNDSSVVLISLLDTCLAVSKYFPAVFKHSFDVSCVFCSFKLDNIPFVVTLRHLRLECIAVFNSAQYQ